MTDATIFVRFTRAGFHLWPQAPERRAYLGSKHRHTFHFEVRMRVTHDDREVEFHDLIEDAHAALTVMALPDGDFGHRSCEMLARDLGQMLARLYQRPVTVIVSEDDECGAQVEIAQI